MSKFKRSDFTVGQTIWHVDQLHEKPGRPVQIVAVGATSLLLDNDDSILIESLMPFNRDSSVCCYLSEQHWIEEERIASKWLDIHDRLVKPSGNQPLEDES